MNAFAPTKSTERVEDGYGKAVKINEIITINPEGAADWKRLGEAVVEIAQRVDTVVVPIMGRTGSIVVPEDMEAVGIQLPIIGIPEQLRAGDIEVNSWTEEGGHEIPASIRVSPNVTNGLIQEWLKENFNVPLRTEGRPTTRHESGTGANWATGARGDDRRRTGVISGTIYHGNGARELTKPQEVQAFFGIQGFAGLTGQLTLRVNRDTRHHTVLTIPVEGKSNREILAAYGGILQATALWQHTREGGIHISSAEILTEGGLRIAETESPDKNIQIDDITKCRKMFLKGASALFALSIDHEEESIDEVLIAVMENGQSEKSEVLRENDPRLTTLNKARHLIPERARLYAEKMALHTESLDFDLEVQVEPGANPIEIASAYEAIRHVYDPIFNAEESVLSMLNGHLGGFSSSTLDPKGGINVHIRGFSADKNLLKRIYAQAFENAKQLHNRNFGPKVKIKFHPLGEKASPKNQQAWESHATLNPALATTTARLIMEAGPAFSRRMPIEMRTALTQVGFQAQAA
jgi:hypothetical protein